MNNSYPEDRVLIRKQQAITSYDKALNYYHTRTPLARISWITWLITLTTTLFWCFTAYQVAVQDGARTISAVLSDILANAFSVQPTSDQALTTVLIRYGAKENTLLLQGQYWRFVTPIFLHANLLHIMLNMLNLVVLGVMMEQIVGHTRLFLIYMITGVVSIIASFAFAPDVVSIGASGAIFGLVGAYSVFILRHRHAFRLNGIYTLLGLLVVIGVNLGAGLFIANVDNYAHVGGLISGCILGWWFTPLYRQTTNRTLVDTHRLSHSWLLALLTILGTLLLAILALYYSGH